MNMYEGSGFEREPFSNSPDPAFLLATRQHGTCLQELEISLRLRRGLNVVTGDIGTGKTTLCRTLLRIFAEDKSTDVHLLLDPHFESSEDFLRVMLASVSGLAPEPGLSLWALKEALKQQLFRLGLVEKRLIILVIDEGQKISPENLEILREMLNYETNTSKLLQIVLFGQRELEPLIAAMPNLADRINVRRTLRPLTFREVRQMIAHRLAVASGGQPASVRFTWPAMAAIHLYSGGLPRKAVRLCHLSMLEMLVRGKQQVGLSEVRAAARPDRSAPVSRRAAGLAAFGAALLLAGGLWMGLRSEGPVLGGLGLSGAPALHESAAPRPLAQPTGQDAGQNSAQQVPGQQVSGTADAQPRDAALSSEGLSLRQGEHEGDEPQTARVSLLPQRDRGNDVRDKVDTTRPPLLQVDAGEGPRTVLASGQAAALAQQAAYAAESRGIETR